MSCAVAVIASIRRRNAALSNKPPPAPDDDRRRKRPAECNEHGASYFVNAGKFVADHENGPIAEFRDERTFQVEFWFVGPGFDLDELGGPSLMVDAVFRSNDGSWPARNRPPLSSNR